MRHFFYVFSAFLMFVSCSFGQEEKSFFNAGSGRDVSAPVLESVTSPDSNTVCLTFNEEVVPYSSSFGECEITYEGCSVFIKPGMSLKAGKNYRIEGRVSDLWGNTASFSVSVWGLNENPAGLIINEFTTKGSDASPDRTELYVASGGSLAGICLFDGIPSDNRSYIMFDDEEVSGGSYITVWWTKSLPSGVSEHPEEKVYNFCANSDTGLSENNGILTLALSPSEGAEVSDCIAYSSFESSEYEGFGTKEVLSRINTAKGKGYLKKDTVSSKNSTATRSIARNEVTGKWYVTVTSGSTFGRANTSEAFTE